MHHALSKRERQIMDVVYRKKSTSVREVLSEIPSPPSYSAVRAMMNILESKGFLRHKKVGLSYIYSPVIPRKKAMFSEMKKLLRTYFDDSLEEAVAALIEVSGKNLTEEEFEKLAHLIENAGKKEEVS